MMLKSVVILILTLAGCLAYECEKPLEENWNCMASEMRSKLQDEHFERIEAQIDSCLESNGCEKAALPELSGSDLFVLSGFVKNMVQKGKSVDSDAILRSIGTGTQVESIKQCIMQEVIGSQIQSCVREKGIPDFVSPQLPDLKLSDPMLQMMKLLTLKFKTVSSVDKCKEEDEQKAEDALRCMMENIHQKHKAEICEMQGNCTETMSSCQDVPLKVSVALCQCMTEKTQAIHDALAAKIDSTEPKLDEVEAQSPKGINKFWGNSGSRKIWGRKKRSLWGRRNAYAARPKTLRLRDLVETVYGSYKGFQEVLGQVKSCFRESEAKIPRGMGYAESGLVQNIKVNVETLKKVNKMIGSLADKMSDMCGLCNEF